MHCDRAGVHWWCGFCVVLEEWKADLPEIKKAGVRQLPSMVGDVGFEPTAPTSLR